MTFNEFKNTIISEAESAGINEYELYYSTAESVNVEAFKHEIKEFGSSLDGGVCFRCIVNGRMGYASTEELSAESAKSVVTRAVDNAKSLESDEKEFLGEGGKTYAEVAKKDYDLPGADVLTQTALEGQNLLYSADETVVDGSETGVFTLRNTIAIVNSNGLDLKYDNASSAIYTVALVSDGEEMSDSFELKSGDIRKIHIDSMAKKAVADAKAKLKADVAPTGVYPVVFAPKAMASLLATYSSIFSSETARKGLSKLNGKEGEKIASEVLTIVDDPFYKDAEIPMPFDAEGTPTYKKNVIENGVLKTLLYNLKSASATGKTTTGNASKASYDSKVDIRPFTFYIAPGELSEAELLKRAENGVYIDSLGGLHAGADPISGDFSLQSGGFMIENGEKTKAVKSFTVAGNFYELLGKITAVADNIEKSGYGISITSFASPAVLVEGLSVAGK